MLNISKSRKIYTVSQLNALACSLLEDAFPVIWVSGEISNLAQPSSGHIYFSLKDQMAQIRCAMFRGCNHTLNFKPKNGDHVVVAARVSIYEVRGDYQLIVQSMQLAGDGILHEKFLKLKNKLAEEGLFDIRHKKDLPKLPQSIGVITSSTGAAIRDILSVLNRRFPSIPVVIYPTQVQGSEAARQIVQAIKVANLRHECDVLIVARGGGSLEDLWSFNEEIVVRAIFVSKIPIITGVGHEVDFTISDFVADKRAPTPSAAAELVAPDVHKYLSEIKHLSLRIDNLIQNKLWNTTNSLTNLKHRLRHPLYRLQQQAQRLDDLEQRLKFGTRHLFKHLEGQLNKCAMQLTQNTPLHRIAKNLHKNTFIVTRLQFAMQQILRNYQNHLARLGQALEAINPLATLNRGYAIVTKDAEVVLDAAQVKKSDHLDVKLAKGQLDCVVENIKNG